MIAKDDKETRLGLYMYLCYFFYRPDASSGLWLGILVGLSAAATILREQNSYSEICLCVGTAGFGLVLCSICLYMRLSIEKVAVKDFHAIYFLPAIVTSLLFLFLANRGIRICKLFLKRSLITLRYKYKWHVLDMKN